jgi:hypothetical protein
VMALVAKRAAAATVAARLEGVAKGAQLVQCPRRRSGERTSKLTVGFP